DERLRQLLAPLHHRDTDLCVRAERALNRHLQGGCQVPIACYAELQGDELWLRGLVGDPDGGTLLRAEGRGNALDPESLGVGRATVVVTRPAGGADGLIEAWRAAGGAVRHVPLLAIARLLGPADADIRQRSRELALALDRYQRVIAVSVNAVHFGLDWLEQFW